MTPSDGTELRRRLGGVARRITLYRISRVLCRSVLLFSLPGLALLAASRLHPLPGAPFASGAILVAGALWGLIAGLRRRSDLLEAAILADRRLALREMLPAALEVDDASPLAATLARRAVETIRPFTPSRLCRFALPWEIPVLFLLASGALALAVLIPPRLPRPAPPTRASLAGSQAARIRDTAEEIEERFPDAPGEVVGKLRDLASRLDRPGEDPTRTVEAVARLAEDAERDAGRLEGLEEDLARAADAATRLSRPPEGAEGEGGRRKAADAVRRLAARAGRAPGSGSAAKEALEALEGGDLPALRKSAERLRRELQRIRSARLAMETAALRLRAAWEKLDWAWKEEGGKGAAPPPRAPRPPAVAAPDLEAYERSLDRTPWRPVHDEVVRRYFAALGGE